jgi:protein phosphatase
LVGREVIRPEVAGQHPLRHVLSRTIGTQSSVVPEVRQLTLLPGEGLILATDGFYRVMAGEELAQIAKNRWRHGARSVCEALAKCARKREAGDDLTLVVVKRLAKPGMTTATL